MRSIGSTKHQFFAIQKVHQARIALGVLHDERNHSFQDFLKAHFANHESADFLEEAQLLLGPLQAQFEVFGFWHDFIIAIARGCEITYNQ